MLTTTLRTRAINPHIEFVLISLQHLFDRNLGRPPAGCPSTSRASLLSRSLMVNTHHTTNGLSLLADGLLPRPDIDTVSPIEVAASPSSYSHERPVALARRGRASHNRPTDHLSGAHGPEAIQAIIRELGVLGAAGFLLHVVTSICCIRGRRSIGHQHG